MSNIRLLRKAGQSQLVGRAYLKAVSEGSTTAHATSRTSLATLVHLSLQKVYNRSTWQANLNSNTTAVYRISLQRDFISTLPIQFDCNWQQDTIALFNNVKT